MNQDGPRYIHEAHHFCSLDFLFKFVSEKINVFKYEFVYISQWDEKNIGRNNQI